MPVLSRIVAVDLVRQTANRPVDFLFVHEDRGKVPMQHGQLLSNPAPPAEPRRKSPRAFLPPGRRTGLKRIQADNIRIGVRLIYMNAALDFCLYDQKRLLRIPE